EGQHGKGQAGHNPRRMDQPGGINIPAVAALEPAQDSFIEAGWPFFVTVNAVLGALGHRLDHCLGGPEVHVCHPHGQQILPAEGLQKAIPLDTAGAAALNHLVEGTPHAYTSRAAPVFLAASATAWATAGTTRESKGEGMMHSAVGSGIRPAMAWAAAIFMAQFSSVARTSRAPRKMPGKPSTLLIWLG